MLAQVSVLIYQSSGGAATAGLATDSAVCVLDFGGDFRFPAGLRQETTDFIKKITSGHHEDLTLLSP